VDRNVRSHITPEKKQSGFTGAVDTLFSYVGGGTGATSGGGLGSAGVVGRERSFSGSDGGGSTNLVSQKANSRSQGSLYLVGASPYLSTPRAEQISSSKAFNRSTSIPYSQGK